MPHVLFCLHCHRAREISLDMTGVCPFCHQQTIWLSERPATTAEPLTFNDKKLLHAYGIKDDEPVSKG